MEEWTDLKFFPILLTYPIISKIYNSAFTTLVDLQNPLSHSVHSEYTAINQSAS